jgi:hypothetical protein
MDLTSRQRMLAFAITALALAGLGVYLFLPASAKQHAASPSSSPAATSQPVSSPSSAQPTGSTAASSQVNIYQWLPFAERDLARAANVVTQFAAYYGTYSYNESAASYVSRMQDLATSQLVQTIERGYVTPGVASLRAQQKRIYSGSAVIDSLRAFGPSSLTFVVTVNQKITGAQGQSQASVQYAVTVVNSGSGWQVNDIQLASAGNP